MSAPSKAMQSQVHPTAGPASRRHQKHASGEISTVAWVPSGDLDDREWAKAGRRFGVISRCSQWWVGDWLRYGTQKWGEKYVQAARITGYDVASLRNIAWVASQFDVSLRSDRLSWSHHALLAPLETDEKAYWLERATAERLSVVDLRTELRALRSGKRDERAGADELSEDGRGSLICSKCGQELRPEGGGGG
jgi:hypothetical protein